MSCSEKTDRLSAQVGKWEWSIASKGPRKGCLPEPGLGPGRSSQVGGRKATLGTLSCWGGGASAESSRQGLQAAPTRSFCLKTGGHVSGEMRGQTKGHWVGKRVGGA